MRVRTNVLLRLPIWIAGCSGDNATLPHIDPIEDHDELAVTLGPDNTLGYHIELFGQTPIFWDDPRRGDGSRFPCMDEHNVYTGCLGPECWAETCWAGRLVPSAVNATPKSSPLPSSERVGVRCHTCAHAVDTANGLVDCGHDHFDRPITLPCLIRQRVPETVQIPCPDYEPATETRPELEAYWRGKREQSARRKAIRQARLTDEPGE